MITSVEGVGGLVASTSTIRTNLPTTPSSTPSVEKANAVETRAIPSFSPHKLNEATLMSIFAFLDPLDVMSFAQANKALLSKVNVMFGMGSSGEEEEARNDDSDGKQGHTSSKEEPGDLLTVQPKEQSSPFEPTPTIVPLPPKSQVIDQTTSIPPTAPSSTTGSRSPPKLFALQGPSTSHHRRQGSGASVSTAGSGGGNPFTQVFSRFGGTTAGVISDVASPALNSAVAQSLPPLSSESGSEIKFNAAMANSMAAKLTPAELSIILRMRERLQKCEADANKWRLEKEDAVANLDSVKAVKEFLVARVRDTEKLVDVQKEEMKQIRKKNLEDQEVIVYLDEKVKDLERRIEDLKTSEEKTKKESLQLVQKHEKKVQVLSDMLQFEREQSVANENEWKIAKKLLVNEVKSCRARLMGLEAEVEGCRQQNTQLKHGLSSASPKKKKIRGWVG